MQIQTSYSFTSDTSQTIQDRNLTPFGEESRNGNSGVESPEYKAISNKASMLFASAHISASESTKILNLLARAKNADESGAKGELNALIHEMKNLDPGSTSKDVFSPSGNPKTPEVSNGQDEQRVTYKDQSDDVGVSFSYPVAMNQYQAPLAVQAHEGEHVMIARAEALMNNENITTYVTVHTGYDSQGRLITTGGTTTVKTSPREKMKPLVNGTNINVTA